MEDINSNSRRVVCVGEVISNAKIQSRFYKLKIRLDAAGARAFVDLKPGQFAQFDLSATSVPPIAEIPADLKDKSQRQILLRRPFSFSGAGQLSDGSYYLEILYCVLGPATLRMTTLKRNQQISLIGPLGNGFSVRADKSTAILVAGGMGAPPLLHLAEYLRSKFTEIAVTAIVGAKSSEQIPFTVNIDNRTGAVLEEFSKLKVGHLICTDDGSLGFHGLVTEKLTEWLEKSGNVPSETAIYACGPQAMLAAVAKIANSRKIACQISTERMMACGIGLCQSCAVEVSQAGGESAYSLCCKDGPVFDSKVLVFDK